MKIYTSYFYQIRHFSKNMIPVSTAKWDPKWFHENQLNPNHIFKDKNGVYNGIRYGAFAPENTECRGPQDCTAVSPDKCGFLKLYRQQLNKLDFCEVMRTFNELCDTINQYEHFEEEPIIVLIVYETPGNPCSERKIIQEWFMSHGVEVEEWSK